MKTNNQTNQILNYYNNKCRHNFVKNKFKKNHSGDFLGEKVG